MLTATAVGDRALLVHGPSGEVLDTDGSTPITGARFDVSTALAAPSGRDVLITDSGNFQTVLFSFDSDEPSFFPGRALAVGDDLVVTTQNVGNEANVTVFGHDGSSVTDARSPSVRAGMLADGSVILVTVDGEIIELTVSNGTTSAVGTLDIGTVQTGHVDPTGTRLIVTGDAGTAIVDDAGAVLGTFTDGAPLLGVDELAPHTSSCIGVTADPQGSGSDVGLTIASLDDGSIVAEAVAEPPLLSSVDGCTVVATAESGLSIIDGDGVADRAADGALVAVTPDGRSVVTESSAGRLLLAAVADLPDATDAPTEQPDASVPGTSAPSWERFRRCDRFDRSGAGVASRALHPAMSGSGETSRTTARSTAGRSRSSTATRSGGSSASSSRRTGHACSATGARASWPWRRRS